jgi:S-(hydroxymethyl)glutathione dehydrogenase / alcohol dehydrogenase
MTGSLRFRAAAALPGRVELSVEEVEASPPESGEVLVEVQASGICASDRHVMASGMNFGGSIGVVGPPIVLGHELAGRVVEVGPGVAALRIGDRVVGASTPACGRCRNCVAGFANMCQTFVDVVRKQRYRTADWAATAMCGLGSFAEMAVVHESQLVRVDTSLPDVELALIGCAVVSGAGAVFHHGRIAPGSTVAVIGCGGVGLAALQAARISGAVRIVAVDPSGPKRALAAKLGATDLVDPALAPVVAQVLELTSGRGVDVAVEAYGSAPTTEEALAITGMGGICIQVGTPQPGEQVRLGPGFGERVFVSSVYGSGDVRRDIPRLVALAEAKRFDLVSLVSTTVPLLPGPVTAAVTAPDPDAVRTVILPKSN